MKTPQIEATFGQLRCDQWPERLLIFHWPAVQHSR